MLKLGPSTVADRPAILLGQSDLYPRATSIRVDAGEAGRLATQHLIDLGHRRIAHVGSRADLSFQDQTRGYRRAMRDAGLTVPREYEIDIHTVPRHLVSLEMARNAARILLSCARPPTGVFAYWDEIAAGIALEALERGLRVPGDLAVIGVVGDGADLKEQTRRLVPMGISTVWFDQGALVDLGIRTLLARVEGRRAPSGDTPSPVLRAAASTIG